MQLQALVADSRGRPFLPNGQGTNRSDSRSGLLWQEIILLLLLGTEPRSVIRL